jgi:transglutaminase-like putative cysteine protease
MAQAAPLPNPSLQPSAAAPARRPHTFRYLNNVYFRDGIWATGLLAALLYLVLAVSLDSAGHVPSGMGIVVPVTLGAIVLGALMSFSRFDSFFALSHALFTGLALILFLMARLPSPEEFEPILSRGLPELQARSYFVLLRLLGWLDAARNRSASADNFVFIFEMAFLVWWLTFLGMWSILRYGYIWRAVVPAALVLVVNAYYAPDSVLTLLGIFAVLALFLLVRANLSEQQLRWRDGRVVVANDLTWEFVRTGLTYSVIVLAVAWLLPGLGRSMQVRQLLSPINEQWESAQQEVTRLYQGLNRREDPGSAAFGRSLSMGGPRTVGDNFVFNVEASAGRYWRAVTFDTWTGRGWVNSAETETNLAAFQPIPIGNWSERAPVTQTVTLMANTGNVVFGAPDIRQASLPLDALVGAVPATPFDAPSLGEGLPAAVEFSMVRARENLDVGDRYTILSNATAVSVEALANASTDYPAAILDRYVQIPESFPASISSLAQSLTVSETTAYGKVKAIESYLRAIPYNDAIAAPPADRDPLEYFLFDLREGYCDYYASSMAMMVRSLGIPARAASGYAEGTFDEESGAYFINERDAHTWVEVFFPELGWVEFEPTAGESPLERPLDDASGLSTMTNEEAPPTPAPNQDRGPDAPPPALDEGLSEFDATEPGAGAPWWLWAVVTPIVLILAGWMVVRTRIAGPTAFTPELPVLLFERLQRWAGRIGLAPRDSDTPWEQARSWSRALPEGSEPIERITGSYVRLRFSRPHAAVPLAGAGGPEQGELQADAQAWQTLQPLFLKEWARRLLPGRSRGAEGYYTLSDRTPRDTPPQ